MWVNLMEPKWFRNRLLGSAFNTSESLVGPYISRWWLAGGQGLPDALGGGGHVDVGHAQVRHGVDHRVVDGRGGADGARLADSLGPQRVHRAGRLGVAHLEAGQLGRAGHEVVGQIGGAGIGVLVVLHPLEQRLGRTLGHAAVLLAGHQKRIHDGAAVVHRHVAQQLHSAGLGVHLHHGHVGPEREGGPALVEIELVGDHPAVGRRGQIGPRRGLSGNTGHVQAAFAYHDVVRAGLKLLCSQLLGLGQHLFAGLEHRAARGLKRAGTQGARASGNLRGVRLDEPDVLHGHAQEIADDHRERRLVALAVGTGAHPDLGGAVAQHVHPAVLGVQAQRSGDLHVGRHADAQQLGVAGAPPGGLLGPQIAIAGSFQRGVQRLLVLAGVVVGTGDGGVGELVGADEVAPADLGGVDAQLVGPHV